VTHISIRRRDPRPDGTNACLVFDHGEEFPISISDPFSESDEARLEWYFEHHLRFPFTHQVDAQEAGESITAYGEALFNQVFADRNAYARYKEALQSGIETLAFEIAGPPDFHALHWEALKDPDLPQPLALQAPMVRRNLTPQTVRAQVCESPTINLLVVTARPGGARDVGYRTISRPLVEGLRQAGVPVRVEILRPGTYRALVDHLEAVQDKHGAGFYHVVHFDVHGALLSYEQFQAGVQSDRFLFQARYGRDDIAPYEGLKAFLSLEGPKEGQSDPVEAQELADLLVNHHIPIVILNACQSGKQVRAEADEAPPAGVPAAGMTGAGTPLETRETSLGSRLMSAGVQMVLAMGYSVTVTAAELLMTTLYEQLFAGQELPAAIRRGRLELYNDKGRRAYFNQTIDLEDWLLPVVYQNQEQRLETRDFTAEEATDYYERHARRYRPPEVTYGFVGRDLDILEIERRLLTQRNLLLIRGMGGAGKTTLLHHLAAWWQTTGFVDRVCYFGYDKRAWTRQQIMVAIARELMTEAEYVTTFQPLSPEAQQALLAQRLRAEPHLLILDNLESITGTHLAIKNTLSEEEQRRLHAFLSELVGGRTIVLLGSRGGEEWLAPATFVDNVYDLPGLDPEAASTLADRILERHGATQCRQDEDLLHLLHLLDGYPLPMEVVLANLTRQTPAQVLEALQAGDDAIDMRSESKTESILRCIDYSHANLSPDAQQLLSCLAPFTSVVFQGALEEYTAHLRQQPALADLPFERWQEVLDEAVDWGLLRPHPQAPGYLRLQPILPYFLRSRLAAPEQAETKQAIETAFRQLYDQYGGEIAGLLTSREAQEKQHGQVLTGLEYENLITAVNLALEARISFYEPYNALSQYLQATNDYRRHLELSQAIDARAEHFPREQLPGDVGLDLARCIEDVALCQLKLKNPSEAKAAYQRELDLLDTVEGSTAETRGKYAATVHHQLGRVAQAQRQWTHAEGYYQQALEIWVAFDDRCAQAKTYHNLGAVAQAQRQWVQAERYYQQALEIFIAFDDRYAQASTYGQLGNLAEQQRQWAQAEGYYQQALEIEIAFDDRYAQASTYGQLGNLAEQQRQWAQAEKYYQQALQIYIEFSDRYHEGIVYHQLGRVAQEGRRWAQAEQYYQQALEIEIAFDDRYAQASTYHQLGVVAQEQRQWAQAEGHYQQALEMFIAFDDRYHQGLVYHQLGAVVQERRQWAQAEGYYQQALEIFIAFDDCYSQASTYHNLGAVAEGQRQWAQAEGYYQQALGICVELDDRYSQAKTYHQLGILAQGQRQCARAAQYYHQALGIKIEFDDRYSQASTYHQLGRVAQEQRQWTEARHYFLKALSIAVEFKDEYGIGMTLPSLASQWRVSQDEGLPTGIAAILEISPEEAADLLRRMAEGEAS
jgi:tetratricopeptide (TPR) repeat protein